MIKSLWTAKTGLESQQVKMDVISNNLANVSTNGFKKSRAVFEDLLYQNLRQPGGANDVQNTLPSGMQVGSGVRPVATERLHSQGGLENTGNSRDLAINGKGFFQVRMPDGNVAFTRDGSFQLDQNGQIPAMVGEVARSKVLAVVLGKAKVVDTKGKAVDVSAFTAAVLGEGDDESNAADLLAAAGADDEHAGHNH